MACHLFLGGDREQLFEEQTLPEQPNTSSCVRLAPSPELSPCSCGRQGRNGEEGSRPPTHARTRALHLSEMDRRNTAKPVAASATERGSHRNSPMKPQDLPLLSSYPGWDTAEATQKSATWHIFGKSKPPYGRYTKWHIQAYSQSSVCCQQNRLIQYFGPQRGKTQKSKNISHY